MAIKINYSVSDEEGNYDDVAVRSGRDDEKEIDLVILAQDTNQITLTPNTLKELIDVLTGVQRARPVA